MKQELSEVQKFFHERPLPTGKQPFVIRLHVHVHVLQRATCHLFIHCQLNGSGGPQALVEHQKVQKALGKDYLE